VISRLIRRPSVLWENPQSFVLAPALTIIDACAIAEKASRVIWSRL